MIRLATYNIRKGVGLDWRRRPERIVQVLAELRPDIVALQEADRRFGERAAVLDPDALAEQTGLAPVRVDEGGAGLGWHGNVVLLSARAQALNVAPTALPSLEPRGALIVDALVEGRRLRLAAAHLGLRPADRRRQAAALLAQLESRADGSAEALMGDLNEWRAAGGCLTVLERRLRPAPPLPSFHASAPIAPLDRVLLGRGLRLAAHGVHRSAAALRASDHLPVWADVAFEDAPEDDDESAHEAAAEGARHAASPVAGGGT
ncbi:endonuclease/exonuclease/phosphatase family protein [Oceanicella actignis]|uniref:endonuclease/exonuclease/phosphatase family protein n=1 Tax=Oceanicella actignis TaxID=1189325 RepID=UPI0012511E72|nr:endonuclease/exonuclease/phosphatase family protein [Oceanicella actignis]TYO90891.1 endonuclease/exonuclease/phosphatase family metal-dependent hydrolase [Oceanicella actignis]